MLICTSLKLEKSKSVKQFSEESLIPVLISIEMKDTCNLAFIHLVILCKDPDFSHLEFYTFGVDGVIAVVREEHDVRIALVAETFVVWLFEWSH